LKFLTGEGVQLGPEPRLQVGCSGRLLTRSLRVRLLISTVLATLRFILRKDLHRALSDEPSSFSRSSLHHLARKRMRLLLGTSGHERTTTRSYHLNELQMAEDWDTHRFRNAPTTRISVTVQYAATRRTPGRPALGRRHPRVLLIQSLD
jgi:hypothetical protein